MKKIQNQKLKASLKEFVIKACQYFDEIVPPTGAYEDLQIWTIILPQEEHLKTFGEFGKALKIINSDSHIQKLVGKLVGTLMSKSNIGTSEDLIINFATRHYLKNKSFNEVDFDDQYLSFEELFFSDKISFVDYARLHHFESDKDEILLEDGLKIKKFPRTITDQERITEMQHSPLTQFSISEFIIERRYERKKRVEGDGNPPIDVADTKYSKEFNIEANETNEIFDSIIKSLRILKPSAIFREYKVTTETLTYFPHAGTMTRFPLISEVLSGDKCSVRTTEINELLDTYKKIKTEKDNRFIIASNRLSFGMTRKTKEDKLIDYMIGLESLYLPGIYDELSFRLSVRVAFTLETTNPQRTETFKFIKKMYNSRSKIVHGEAYDLGDEDIVRVEKVLRRSLKLWVKTPKAFEKDKFDDKLFQQ